MIIILPLQIEMNRFSHFFESPSPFQIAEIIILLVIICFQIYSAFRVAKYIYRFRHIFNYPLIIKNGVIEKHLLHVNTATIDDIYFDDYEADDDFVKIAITKTEGNHEVLKRVERSINTYLLNNYGANVNFSIIKDMIDREVEVKDEEISQTVPTPLYLGLAATMFGIIFGLSSMPIIDKEGSNFTSSINYLIDGVFLAMIASVIGLFLTTLMSSFFYKRAKKKIQIQKNDQISALQAELLPELIKSEESGVSGLKASLDLFARKAGKIVEDVNKAVENTGKNLIDQLFVLEKVDQLKVSKVTKANLELFNKLDNNMKAFNKFSKNVALIEDISTNLKEFALRTGAIDTVAKQIDSSLQESKKLSRFLTEHFEKIENNGNQAVKAVTYSDAHFKEAIEELTEEVKNRISALNKTANDHQGNIQEVYNEIGSNLHTITEDHINEFRSAYSDAVPKFDQLDNLEILTPIKESIDQNLEERKNGSSNLIEIAKEIKANLNKESDIKRDNQRLEKAIDDLTIAVTGKEIQKEDGKQFNLNVIFKKIELPLRIIGWTVITSIGIYTILNHFNIVN